MRFLFLESLFVWLNFSTKNFKSSVLSSSCFRISLCVCVCVCLSVCLSHASVSHLILSHLCLHSLILSQFSLCLSLARALALSVGLSQPPPRRTLRSWASPQFFYETSRARTAAAGAGAVDTFDAETPCACARPRSPPSAPTVRRRRRRRTPAAAHPHTRTHPYEYLFPSQSEPGDLVFLTLCLLL